MIKIIDNYIIMLTNLANDARINKSIRTNYLKKLRLVINRYVLQTK